MPLTCSVSFISLLFLLTEEDKQTNGEGEGEDKGVFNDAGGCRDGYGPGDESAGDEDGPIVRVFAPLFCPYFSFRRPVVHSLVLGTEIYKR